MADIAQVAFNLDARFLLVLAIVALVLLFVLSGSGKRRGAAGAAGHKRCPSCAADHPGFARFCRKCGTKLPE